MPFYRSGVRAIALALLLLSAKKVTAQLYPAEASSFYAMKIPFRAEKVEGARAYVYKFAVTRFDEDGPFEKAVFKKIRSENSISIIQMPEYEKLYSWQVEYIGANGKKIGESPISHFRTISPEYADSNKYRIRVIENKYPDTSLHFMLDNTGALYDLRGKPTWFSPQIVNNSFRNQSSNLAVTPDNTVTFIMNERAYEINYNGDVLWMSPEYLPGGQKNVVHHEFVKRKNGNYMLLSWESEDRNIPVPDLQGNIVRTASSVSFGTIEEYDKKGNSVWRWSSDVCFKDDQLVDKLPNGVLRPRGRTHTNAFYFDEAEGMIYVGFKDLSRIVKLRYADKQIVNIYEGLMTRKDALFTEQHSISKTWDGKMLVYSNNISVSIALPNVEVNKISMDNAVSSIVLLEPAMNGADVNKLAEYKLNIDTQAPSASGRGGNVIEMADGNYFVCMGASPRILILSAKGEVLYNAIVEEWGETDRKWQPYPQYRAMPVTQDQLKGLILRSIPE